MPDIMYINSFILEREGRGNLMSNELAKRGILKQIFFSLFNRYRRKRPKVDASIFDSALSHTGR